MSDAGDNAADDATVLPADDDDTAAVVAAADDDDEDDDDEATDVPDTAIVLHPMHCAVRYSSSDTGTTVNASPNTPNRSRNMSNPARSAI
jgi:hypothetical protein